MALVGFAQQAGGQQAADEAVHRAARQIKQFGDFRAAQGGFTGKQIKNAHRFIKGRARWRQIFQTFLLTIFIRWGYICSVFEIVVQYAEQ